MNNLPPPHGGKGVLPCLVHECDRESFVAAARNLPKITLSPRSFGDLQMLAIGGLTPLAGFMGRADWQAVCEGYCLKDGTFWPMPILLDIDKDEIAAGMDRAALTYHGKIVGVIDVVEIWHSDEKDRRMEAELVYRGNGEDSQGDFLSRALDTHPGVQHVFQRKQTYLAGRVTVLSFFEDPGLPSGFVVAPEAFRQLAHERGWQNITCMQLRNPPHRSHEFLARIGLEISDALLIHTPVGGLKKDDLPASVRCACMNAMADNYLPRERLVIAGYPLDMRYAGPREALLHATFRQNFGIANQIVGRDHAGVGDFYAPFEAQDIFDKIPKTGCADKDLQTRPLKIMWPFYCKKCDSMATLRTCPHRIEDRELHSGSMLRKYLAEGVTPPKGFIREEVYAILAEYYAHTLHEAPKHLYGASSGATMAK